MIERAFQPGFRIELHQKDLNLALQSARDLGVALPNTATCQELFNACRARGGGAWDHSALVRAIEVLSDYEVEPAGHERPPLLERLFRAAVDATAPARCVPPALPPPPAGRTVVVGAGKASAAMARAVEDHWAGPLSDWW